MSRFIDPSGNSTYGLGICARCSRKMSLTDLVSDPNYPNLMVCREDRDDYDPYRLAPRAPDKIVLPFNRPDTNVAVDPGVVVEPDGTQVETDSTGQPVLFLFD